MNLIFKKGKAQIKDGKKIIATIIDRESFFEGITAKFKLFNPKYPFALQMNGGQAEVETLQEAIDLFYSEL